MINKLINPLDLDLSERKRLPTTGILTVVTIDIGADHNEIKAKQNKRLFLGTDSKDNKVDVMPLLDFSLQLHQQL